MRGGRSFRVPSTCVCTHLHALGTRSDHKRARLRSEDLVFIICYMTGMSLWQLPMEYIDGNPVPTVIFHGKPSTFHAFVLGLVLSLTGAVWAIQFREKNPNAARSCRIFAVGALVVTLAILTWAVVPAVFGWVASFV